MNSTERPYVLHGYEVSFFTAKVRVAMRYKQLFMEEKRANIRMIMEKTGLGFIPIVTTPEGEVWQDSSDIIDRLEARYPSPPLYPETPVHRMVCALIELYSDEFAITPAMHTRWGTPESEAMTRARFGAMMGSAEAGNRAADAMLKARFAVGATPEAGPAIEQHLHASLAALSAHFSFNDFLLGDRMSLADCALMGPVYAHYWTDLVSRRLLLETALPVIRWIEYCSSPGPDDQGEWNRADGISDSLVEVLSVMGKDAVPVLLATIRALEAWADENAKPGFVAPRAIGVAESTLRGSRLTRGAQCYSLWMLQRVLDPYLALPDAERVRVDDALAGTGWEPLLAYHPRHRIEKRGFKLFFSES